MPLLSASPANSYLHFHGSWISLSRDRGNLRCRSRREKLPLNQDSDLLSAKTNLSQNSIDLNVDEPCYETHIFIYNGVTKNKRITSGIGFLITNIRKHNFRDCVWRSCRLRTSLLLVRTLICRWLENQLRNLLVCFWVHHYKCFNAITKHFIFC